ncbi:coiled-coil domain-containing protein [Paenibacillus ihbetae]|uniref:hypothetical protein n=1 Tax=Paenibacillus ihbetae TaxID=1870820 RepID=UPI000F742AA7|nr:hypothetical protein [Paenibacillus ihbetae]
MKIIIDSEWVFHSYVPVTFIVFRSVYSFWIKYRLLLTNHFSSLFELLEKLNIDSKQTELFLSVEEEFFQSFVYGDSNERLKFSRFSKKKINFYQFDEILKSNKFNSRIYSRDGLIIKSAEGFADSNFNEIIFNFDHVSEDLICIGPVDQQAYVQIESITIYSDDLLCDQVSYNSGNNFKDIQYSNNLIFIENSGNEFSFLAFNNEPKLFIDISKLLKSRKTNITLVLKLKVDLNLTQYYRQAFIGKLNEEEIIKRKIFDKDSEITKLKQEMLNLKDIQSEYKNEISLLSSQLKNMTDEIKVLGEKISNYKIEIDDHISVNKDYKEQINELTNNLQEILNSTSWKITAPLRGIKKIIGK